MSKGRPDALHRFLIERSRDGSLVAEAMRHAEPFIAATRRGRFTLRHADRTDAAVVYDALHPATGITFRELVAISADGPPEKPRWMTAEAYWRCLPESLGIGIRSHVEIAFGDRLWKGFRGDEGIALNEVFYPALGWPLAAAVRAGIPELCWSRTIETLRTSLFYLLGLALIGDEDGVCRLIPLLDLSRGLIPLGNKKDEPDVLIVLVA